MRSVVTAGRAIVRKMQRELQMNFDTATVEKMKIEGFVYGPEGIHFANVQYGSQAISDWTRECQLANTQVSETSAFKAFAAYVATNYPVQFNANVPNQYTTKLFYNLFGQSGIEQIKAIRELNQRLVSELTGKPYLSRAVVYLKGMILERTIRIDSAMLLRKTTAADIENQTSMLHPGILGPYPTAVLEIEMKLGYHEQPLLTERIRLMIKILRLSIVGSIGHTHYEMTFNLISGRTCTSADQQSTLKPWLNHFISSNEEKRLIRLIMKLLKKEELLNNEIEISHLNTALDRYSEALVEHSSTERRIASAVMGLEALLSESGAEIKFKLQFRVSKLLSYFFYQPLATRKDIKFAYDIRSSYAHGNALTTKERNKLNNEFGGSAFTLRPYADDGFEAAIGGLPPPPLPGHNPCNDKCLNEVVERQDYRLQ
ncbi:unnamed protein product [Sphagnum tenellum]